MASMHVLLSCFGLVLSLLLTSAQEYPIVSWGTALERGQASLCRLAQSQTASQWTQYDQLKQNGWTETNKFALYDEVVEDILDALSGNQLSTTIAQWHISRWAQSQDFVTASGQHGEATFAIYENQYNPSQGAIIAANNFGPKYSATDKDNPNPILPDLQKWSDVVWLVWANMCASAQTNPNSIQYIFRSSITKDSGTQIIIDQAVGGNDNLQAWPGNRFLATTTNGQALLGSAHGYGVVYFLMQHQPMLGMKTVDYITAFKTSEGNYALMFHITNVS